MRRVRLQHLQAHRNAGLSGICDQLTEQLASNSAVAVFRKQCDVHQSVRPASTMHQNSSCRLSVHHDNPVIGALVGHLIPSLLGAELHAQKCVLLRPVPSKRSNLRLPRAGIEPEKKILMLGRERLQLDMHLAAGIYVAGTTAGMTTTAGRVRERAASLARRLASWLCSLGICAMRNLRPRANLRQVQFREYRRGLRQAYSPVICFTTSSESE